MACRDASVRSVGATTAASSRVSYVSVCSAPAGQTHQQASRPGWQIYIGTHQLAILSWVPLHFRSWLCHGSSAPSRWKTSSRMCEGRTTAQWEHVPLHPKCLHSAQFQISQPGLRMGIGDDKWCTQSLDININWVVLKWLDKVVKKNHCFLSLTQWDWN